jgi:hypothetical protein
MKTWERVAREEANELLEPELYTLCRNMSAAQRCEAANKFARWSEQLALSAMRLDPNIMPMREPPAVKPGFFLLNIARDRQRELRSLAQQCGVSLRTVLGWSFTRAYQRLKEKVRLANRLGVSPRDCWELTESNPDN